MIAAPAAKLPLLASVGPPLACPSEVVATEEAARGMGAKNGACACGGWSPSPCRGVAQETANLQLGPWQPQPGHVLTVRVASPPRCRMAAAVARDCRASLRPLDEAGGPCRCRGAAQETAILPDTLALRQEGVGGECVLLLLSLLLRLLSYS